MKRIYLSLLFLCFLSVASGQAFTGTYDFSSVTTSSGTTDPTAVPVASGITFGSFSAAGVSVNPNAASRFSFTGWPTGATNGSDVFSGVLSATQYFSVTLTPAAGYSLDLNTITFTMQRSGTGIRQFVVRSSLDGYTSNLPASISPANANLSVVATDVFQVLDASSSANNGSTITLGAPFDNITTAVTFRVYGYNAEAAGGSFGVDNVSFSGVASSANPTISINPVTLTGFTSLANVPSAEQNYTVTGSNLTANITVTASAGFEVSGTSGAGFGTSVSIPQTAGNANGTVYVRMNSAVTGTNTGSVLNTSTTASQTVSLTGLVLSGEPTNHATLFACGATGSSSIPLSWADATVGTVPTGYLIKWSTVSYADITAPVDGTPEFNGAGKLNVDGGIQAATVTGLSQSRIYYFKIFPYTNTSTNINYKTDGTVPQTNCTTISGPWEDFEAGTKASYATAAVTLTSGSWTLTDALLGTTADDRKNGTKSVRIRNGMAEMGFDLTNGVGIVRVLHAVYGTDANGTWKLEASTDAGLTWTAYSSADITSSTTTLTAQSFTLNLSGNVRFRIVKTDGGTNRINIDDITYTENAALPVKFAHVRAYQQGAGIQIEWSNLTETGVTAYTVQRAASINFTSLFEQGARKNDGGRADYSFYDASPLPGVNFYRIESAETDGKKLLSVIVKVDTRNGNPTVEIYPNPVINGQFTLQGTGLKKGLYQVRIYNSAGQQVQTLQLNHAGGATAEMIRIPGSLIPGMYSLQISNGEWNSSGSFIVR